MEFTNVAEGLKADRRESYRVEDVLPMVSRRLEADVLHPSSRLLPGFSMGYCVPAHEETPDGTVSPQLWRMLSEINSKLSLFLNKLSLESEGLSKAELRQVSLSTSGIRFTSAEKLSIGDLMELKICLPSVPPSWIVVYGRIARIEQRGGGKVDVAVQFTDLNEEVSDAIHLYALKYQRELMRKRKESDWEINHSSP